jgi:hypothetical protein
MPTILAIDNLVRRPGWNILEVVVSCETGGHNDGLMETLKYIMQSQLYPIMYLCCVHLCEARQKFM